MGKIYQNRLIDLSYDTLRIRKEMKKKKNFEFNAEKLAKMFFTKIRAMV